MICCRYAVAPTPTTEADILTHLGNTHHATGDVRSARDAWQQALAIFNDLDHPDAAQVHAKLASLDRPAEPRSVMIDSLI